MAKPIPKQNGERKNIRKIIYSIKQKYLNWLPGQHIQLTIHYSAFYFAVLHSDLGHMGSNNLSQDLAGPIAIAAVPAVELSFESIFVITGGYSERKGHAQRFRPYDVWQSISVLYPEVKGILQTIELEGSVALDKILGHQRCAVPGKTRPVRHGIAFCGAEY
jgi:hypothetical protein